MSADDLLPPAPRAAPATPRRASRRARRVIGAVVALLAATLAFVLHDLDGKARDALLEAALTLEARTGRHVTLGTVHVSLGRTTELVVHDIVLEGLPGAEGALAQPPIRVPTARLAIVLETLIRSKGAVIDVSSLALDAPELTLVRTATGLSIDDIRARLEAAPTTTAAPRQITVQRLVITGAKLRLLTAAGGPGTELALTVGGTQLRLGGASPSSVSIEASAGAGAGAAITIDLASSIDGAGSARPSIRRIEARVKKLPLAPLLLFGGAGKPAGVDLTDVTLGADVVVEVGAGPGARLGAEGRVELEGLRLDGVAAPLAASLAANVTFEPLSAALIARSLDLRIGDVRVRGMLRGHGLDSRPAFDAVELTGSADAAAILALLPPARHPRGLALGGPVSISVQGAGRGDEAHAAIALELAEIRALDPDAAGRKTRLGATAQVAFHRDGGHLRVDKLDLHLDKLALRGQGHITGVGSPDTAPSVESFSLEADGSVEQLLELAPPSRRPHGVSLQGRFSTSVAAHRSGSDMEGRVKLDLGPARVRAAGFSKAPGVQLAVDLEGRAGRGGGKITRGDLRLGSISLSARGVLESPERMDLSFDERGAVVASVLELFPEAAARLGGASIDGRLAVKGRLRRASGKTILDASALLEEARLSVDAVSIVGAPGLTAHVEAEKGVVSARADIDLGPATVAVSPLFLKPTGRASRIAFSLRRTGESLRIDDARVMIPGLSVDRLGLTSDPGHVHLSAAASISLGPLLEIVPRLDALLPGGAKATTAHFNVDFDGDPGEPEAATLRLSSIDLAGSFGRVRGSIVADGLPRPRVLRINVSGGDLDLGSSGAPLRLPGGDPGPLRIEGHVHLESIQLRGETARAIDADILLDHKELLVRGLHAELMGGTIDVEKSSFELGDTPSFDVHGKLAGLDLARLPGAKELELSGHASGRVALRGRGSSWSAVSSTLSGAVQVALRDVHARPTIHPKLSIVNPLLSAIAARHTTRTPSPARAIDLREVSASFAVGSKILSTTAPIVVRSSAFEAALHGKLGLDRSIALEGQIDVAADALTVLSKGKLRPRRPLPLRVVLSGNTSNIRLELLELGGTLFALRGALRAPAP